MMALPSLSTPFPAHKKYDDKQQTIACELEGALLISRSLFPYFMLIALESGGPIRALALLLASPLLCFLEFINSDEIALHIMIFIATVGLKLSAIKETAKATMPKFYIEDLRASVFKVFSSSCNNAKKFVVTACPRIMVEPFLREFLEVDYVLGTELRTFRGYSLGITAAPGLMVGALRFSALLELLGHTEVVNVGLCSAREDQQFMSLCVEKHWIAQKQDDMRVPRNMYPKPLIFHDGRLVARPTPLDFFIVVFWLPFGVLLALVRVLLGILLPAQLTQCACAATGLNIRAQFNYDTQTTCNAPLNKANNPTLYACNHRTLLDPVIISTTLQKNVTAVTYSVSRLSEMISPIPTVRLSRDRFKDSAKMRSLLDEGDLVVCPEGTTCREPYLLRFSPLFAEIAECIVPVAVTNFGSMFYGTSVRGHKCLDSFFFLMNPSPSYGLNFLERVVSNDQHSNCDIANNIQVSIGQVIGFECTNLTRRDKYRMLAGHDGVCTRS